MIGIYASTASTSFSKPTKFSEEAPEPESSCATFLPEDISDHLSGFLQLEEINSLALSAKNQRTILQGIYADKIEPEYLGKGDAVKLFADPENRKKQYICSDQAGKEYLSNLGIKNPVWIANISDAKNLEWTVDHVLELMQDEGERIETQYPAIDSDRVDLLMDNSTYPYLAKGPLTKSQILALTPNQVSVLSQASVQNALNSGLLNLEQALQMTTWGTYALTNSTFTHALENNQMTIDHIVHLSAAGWGMHDDPGVKKYLDKGILSLATAVEMNAEDLNDLLLPNVQKQLDAVPALMDIDDFLNLTHEQRLALPNE